MTDQPSNTPQPEHKPCPKCGSPAIVGREGDSLVVHVGCFRDEPCTTSGIFCVGNTEAEAIAKWNTRTIPTTESASSVPVVEPIGYLYRHADHVDEFGTLRLTPGDIAAGWTETPLYASATHPQPVQDHTDVIARRMGAVWVPREPDPAQPVQGVAELVEPWSDFHGELPDYDHPLRCVYESGIQYAVELLAKTLNVEEYDVCDGTEEFDGDLSGTLFNIVLAAMPKDADGDPYHPRELIAALTNHAHQARSVALEELLLACREKFDFYRQSHEAKNTPDADAKALVNKEMVERIDRALSGQGGAE